MQWDDLRFFLALARARRLETAGQITGQNATTVARRIQRLEAALQATLFEKTPTGYTPTAAGARLLEQAEGMESLAADAQEGLGGSGGTLGGSIRLSVSEGFGTEVLARRLPRFAASHPGVHIELVATSGFLNPSARAADIAIMLARPKSGPLIVRKLTDYRLGLYASLGYLTAAGEPKSVEDLAGHRLVGYIPDLIYAPELRYLGEIDPRLAPSVQSSSINAQTALIASGAGCGVLPCFLGDTAPGLARIMPGIDLQRSFWLVIHRDVRRLARIDQFVRWLQAELAGLQPLMLGVGPLEAPAA